ncbi:murein hydrolase activator EnvC family protein [Bacilliculturomica massiliensis]|uniref:murein hydrolase activator EnvC family protein n=1 Tax=Bacilliculturomica massiliensis TaxID=1917867 RepID=UPI00103104D0|nr:peptidoglycan DD-metalloendopeptidase family protein [Bacilliculturomica massiliensis]
MVQKKKHRLICYALCAAMLTSFWSLGLTFAGETDDLKDQLDQVNANKTQVQNQLDEGKKEAKKLNQEISDLEAQINATQKEINNIQGDISETKKSIAATEKNLKEIQEQMTIQNSNMNDRLVAMYENDDMSMLEVLLGSASISEFLTNLDLMQRIYESDMELLKSMQETHDKVEKQKKELETMKAKLVAQQQQQAAKQDSLEADQNVVEAKKSEVDKNNAALTAQVDAFNKEAAALSSQIRALQGDGVYSGGALSWPVPGVTRTTSEFGYRIHPILNTKKLHTGLDIGAPKNSTVCAAADGNVIMAGWNNSYGNVVMIDHGSGMVTVYAHNTSLLVSNGQAVTRGQAIAKSGTTGMSTGPHVHFEVRIDGKYQNPRDYL